MILPETFHDKAEWLLTGPMGPMIPEMLRSLPILAVDGGARFTPHIDIWVGDADSYSEDIHSSHIMKLDRDKDASDFAMALRLFQHPLHYKFHVWGFLGGRRDHELFNLGEALTFLDHNQECQMLFYDQAGRLTYYLVGAGHWKFHYKGVFSLGSLKKIDVRMTGECKYPIPRESSLPPLSSVGLSNIGNGDIQLETTGPVFVYFPEMP